jgi:hypothetical protein
VLVTGGTARGSSYEYCCALSDIALPELLSARDAGTRERNRVIALLTDDR